MNKFIYPEPLTIPYDDINQKYIKSFYHNETTEIKKFFDTYGFVVIKNILTATEIRNTTDEIWSILSIATNNKIKKGDISTYDNWPITGRINTGIINRKPIFDKYILNNRQNEKIYNIFSFLLETKDLLVNHDTCLFLRPTKSIRLQNGTITNIPYWKTDDSIKIDMNPLDNIEKIKKLDTLDYNNRLNFIGETCLIDNAINLQGLICLTNNYVMDGGFMCVPGFHKYFTEWTKTIRTDKELVEKAEKYNKIVFDKNDKINEFIVKIPVRVGSMIIWDNKIPYGFGSNDSKNLLLYQFITMFPKKNISKEQQILRKNILKTELKTQLNKGFIISDIGKQVYGLN